MKHFIHTISHSARAAATLLLALLMLAAAPQRAWADTESVNYIDADGNAQTVTATVLTGNEEPSRWGTIDLAAGWYVVKGNISYTNQISYGSSTGTIHIILADGAQMSVECNDKVAISPFLPLAIYGQSAGTGRLSVNAIYASDGITINGGIVSATSTGYGHPAIYADYGAITINGGQVTATPGDNAMGISTEGTITLGGGTVTANGGYYGTVTVALPDGYVYTDGSGNYYANGTLTDAQKSAIAGKTLNVDPDPAHFSVNDAGDEYTIHTATGWNVFCDCLNDNAKGYFSGKTVRLGDDITVTRMAGSSYHDFTGTFDGDGHTLTVSYGSADSPIAENNAAPFRNVESGCLIENLHVTGTITTSQKFAAGLVGTQYGAVTIRNCHVSTVIHSLTAGDGTHGGIVGSNGNGEGSSVTIEGCLFDGKLLTEGTTATTNCSGFVGYKSNNRTVTITNSLYAPADLADGETEVEDGTGTISATFVRNGAAGTNCYYTRALGTPQGKALRTVAAGDNVTLGLSGTDTEYDVSGITAYEGNHGIKYGTTYYAGSGDQLELTLSNTTPAGYQYDGYTTNAGTLSGSTLTMPDEDVTISAALTVIDWATESAGDANHPYMIYNKEQLDLLAYRVNGTHGETLQSDGYDGKYFQLGADIAYTYTKAWNEATTEDDNNYEAIGGYYNSNYRSFRGDFDGAGHTISGIRIHRSGSTNADSYQGIFGMTMDANIHGLRLADARITGYRSLGGIVGNNYGTVTGCHVANNVCINAVQSNAWRHGGIAGENYKGSTVANCTSAATLTIPSDATDCRFYGAIAGYNYATLRDNLAIGATVPTAYGNTHGAIAGYNDGGTLQRNYYTACTVAGVANATNVGCANADVTEMTKSNVTYYDGAVPALRDDADNTHAIALLAALAQTDDDRPVLPLNLGWGEGQFPLQLAGRTLTKDGNWNTLCLPFAVTDGDTTDDITFSGTPLEGATVKELDATNSNLAADGTLTLKFTEAASIVAGKPYIVKWESTGSVSNPVFNSVTISSTAPTAVEFGIEGSTDKCQFVGQFSPFSIVESGATGSDQGNLNEIILMGSGSKLGYSKAERTLKSFRAHFYVPANGSTANARAFVLDFGDGDNTTGIISINADNSAASADGWHDLNGRRLNGQPTQKGVYIVNGKKVVIK